METALDASSTTVETLCKVGEKDFNKREKIWPSFEVKLSKPGCAQLKRIWKHTEIMMTCVVIIVISVESIQDFNFRLCIQSLTKF